MKTKRRPGPFPGINKSLDQHFAIHEIIMRAPRIADGGFINPQKVLRNIAKILKLDSVAPGKWSPSKSALETGLAFQEKWLKEMGYANDT